MKKAKFFITIAVVLLITTVFIAAGAMTVSAAEEGKCFIVTIKGRATSAAGPTAGGQVKAVTVSPELMKVPVGSCVVWVDWAVKPEIRLSFKEGKVCMDTTANPVGFRYTPDTGCYVTNYMVEGDTSSLRFTQAGTYNYEILSPGRIEPLTSGKITVYKP